MLFDWVKQRPSRPSIHHQDLAWRRFDPHCGSLDVIPLWAAFYDETTDAPPPLPLAWPSSPTPPPSRAQRRRTNRNQSYLTGNASEDDLDALRVEFPEVTTPQRYPVLLRTSFYRQRIVPHPAYTNLLHTNRLGLAFVGTTLDRPLVHGEPGEFHKVQDLAWRWSSDIENRDDPDPPHPLYTVLEKVDWFIRTVEDHPLDGPVRLADDVFFPEGLASLSHAVHSRIARAATLCYGVLQPSSPEPLASKTNGLLTPCGSTTICLETARKFGKALTSCQLSRRSLPAHTMLAR